MTKKKELFLKEEEVEKRGLVNASVGTQKLVNVELIGGKYDGIIQEMTEIKAKRMVHFGKAKYAPGKAKVIDPEFHEQEARNLAQKKKDAAVETEK